jgi:hypothetical protein
VEVVVTLKHQEVQNMVAVVKAVAVWDLTITLVNLLIQNVTEKPTQVAVVVAVVTIQEVAAMAALE